MRLLKLFLVLVPVYLIFQIFYSGFYFLKAKELTTRTHASDIVLGKGGEFLLYVVGDSVGAGVGATSFKTSVAGRVALKIAKNHQVKLTNKSVSGYKMGDLLEIELPSRRQDLILIIIGSNDLFRLTNIKDFEKDTENVFKRFAQKSEKMIIVGPGRVFDTEAIPIFMKPLYRYFGEKYAAVMKREAEKYKNIIYVNPLEATIGYEEYGDTSASDRFHPNDEGHRFWFDLISAELREI